MSSNKAIDANPSLGTFACESSVAGVGSDSAPAGRRVAQGERRMMIRTLVASVALLTLSGCALFVPFESEFMCEATNEYGQCITVEGAYDQALGGKQPEGKAPKPSKKRKGKDKGEAEDEPAPDAEAYSRYRAAEYDRMSALMEGPVTPLVRPPKVLRTLVVAYSEADRTLYSPRFIFYFADEGGFVFGDYLNAVEDQSSRTLYPNGKQ